MSCLSAPFVVVECSRGIRGGRGAVTVPAIRRCGGVLGIRQDLKALSKNLLRDGENAILIGYSMRIVTKANT